MQVVLYIQSLYIFITAMWPIIDIESFYKITGYKKETWLVKTVSVLLLCISISQLVADYCKQINISIIMLSLLTSAGLLFVDCYYVIKKIIPVVYLLDALAECLLIILWLGYLCF
jgi:hypothetical protein